MDTKKNNRICLRLSNMDIDWLRKQAERYEMSMSEYIRYLIWTEQRHIFGKG